MNVDADIKHISYCCIICYFETKTRLYSNHKNREQNVNATLALSIAQCSALKWILQIELDINEINLKVPVGPGITRDETHRYLPQRAPTRGEEAIRPLTISTWFPEWAADLNECLIPESSYMTHQRSLFLARNIYVACEISTNGHTNPNIDE